MWNFMLVFLVLCVAAASAFQLPVNVQRNTAPRVPDVALVQRSKEAQQNIEKWGKILSQADTFDDSNYRPSSSGKRKQGGNKERASDGKAAGNVVVAGSAAVVVAMMLASVGQ